MFITTELMKDVHSAVNYALDMARHHNNFFIDTTFGTIPVEMDFRTDDVVIVEDWATCSVTNFVRMNHHNKYDKVIRINYVRGQHSELTKLEFAWAFSYILVNKFCTNLSSMYIKKYADALCLQYMRTYLMTTSPSSYAEWYINAHNQFARFNSKNYAMLIKMTVQNIRNRFHEANDVLLDVEKLIRQGNKIKEGDYGNEFYDTLMAIYIMQNHKFNRDIYLEAIDGITKNPLAKIHVMDIITYII